MAGKKLMSILNNRVANINLSIVKIDLLHPFCNIGHFIRYTIYSYSC